MGLVLWVIYSDKLFCTEHLFCHVSHHGSCHAMCRKIQVPCSDTAVLTDMTEETHTHRFEILIAMNTRVQSCALTPCCSAASGLFI